MKRPKTHQRRKQKRDRTRKPVDYAESTPIPPAIQAKITEILTERGFARDGKIVRRPAIPKQD